MSEQHAEEKANTADVLPERSKKAYLTVYEAYTTWKSKKKITFTSEPVLLAYFKELSDVYKPSSLYWHFSLLKTTLPVQENVNIEDYYELQAFLKDKSEGFEAKKTLTFNSDNIKDFLANAPDEDYLPTKVALILGVLGPCLSIEMYQMKMGDLQDLGTALLVNLQVSRTKQYRKFIISHPFYDICSKYISGRMDNPDAYLFQHYRKGHYINQRIGISKFIRMGRDVAKFLNFDNFEQYSGHSFRSSAAYIIVDADGNISSKPSAPAREPVSTYTNSSSNSSNSIVQMNASNKTSEVDDSENVEQSKTDESLNFDIYTRPRITFTNCHNITININIITTKSNKTEIN